MLRRFLALLVLLSLAGFGFAHAEGAPAEGRLTGYFNAGIFGGGGRWPYQHVNESGEYETTLSYGAGLQFEIGHISSCPVGIAIEGNKIEIRITEKGMPESSRGAASAHGYVVPLELWGYISSPGRFGPFVRGGIGALKTKVTENFTRTAWADNRYEAWSFCYQCGGGLRFAVTERFDLVGYLEGCGATEEIAADTEAGVGPILGTGSYTTCGLRLAYRF